MSTKIHLTPMHKNNTYIHLNIHLTSIKTKFLLLWVDIRYYLNKFKHQKSYTVNSLIHQTIWSTHKPAFVLHLPHNP